PVMDGLEATIAIRSYERENQRHPTPIFLLSGNDTPAEITRYARAGINAFLPKPLDRSELLQAILTHTVQP
ncbi:MAG: response regulator, partial [Proteobacteria bacterium]|nr:response regulator [Pseudomonadota bacterium]